MTIEPQFPDKILHQATKERLQKPRILVFTTVYPNEAQPNFGLFVRARMSRVAADLPLVVVAPVAWFPFLGLFRRFKPGFRPEVKKFELQNGIEVHHPRFFSVPGHLKFLDGFFIALASYRKIKSIQKKFDFDIIDSHFVFPDGHAASILGQFFEKPFTITLRGQISALSRTFLRKKFAVSSMLKAVKVFSVSESLRQGAIEMGERPEHIRVIGNGVDLDNFYPENAGFCRQRLGLSDHDKVLISVGGLTERKGFHRVIELLPELLKKFNNLHLVIAGGPSPEGNWEEKLKRLTMDLRLTENVHFLGPISPQELRYVYSAGNVFVLATRMEGWANVFLEAMACGLPVVTTQVGGNVEVVCSESLGITVPYGDSEALRMAIEDSLQRNWNNEEIIDYARDNSWKKRIPILIGEFEKIVKIGNT